MTGPLKIKRIEHVAICVANIDEAISRWTTLLGVGARDRQWVASQETEAALIPLGETSLELVTPRGNAGLQRFLEKRGPALHHVAIEVEDIEAALSFLKSIGVALVDESPRPGARGHKVAFVHPRATGGVLVELVESAPDG
ncbi:MAG TPA: methylmalonyl-CoA epimerase [Polyangiaceae bacterium]|nr:methylmalonyl-CoA epimerase [Polyangiaceae bacterium]